MRFRAGWKPAFALPLVASSLEILTLRMVSVCKLTTVVYVSAATLSIVFCFEAMSMKPLSVNGFADMDRMETA
jgi:hypothetical protein